MENKLIILALTLTVSVIVVGALLVPVINDSVQSFAEPYDNGPESANKNYATYSTDPNFEVTMIKDGDSWSIDGIDNNPLSSGSYILTDNCLVVLSTVNGYLIRGLDESLSFITLSPTSWNGVTASVTSIKISVTGSAITVSDASSTQESITFPNTYVIYSDTEGDRVICTNHTTLYTNGGSDIISVGLNNTGFFWTTNGSDSKAVYDSTLLDTTLNCPLTEVTEDVDTVDVGNGGTYTVTAAYGGSSYDLSPQFVSVPKIVFQETGPGTSITPILKAIPVVVILSLLVLTVGGVIIRRQ